MFCALIRYDVKVKLTPEQGTKAPRGSGGITTFSISSALDGVGDQRHAPAALPLGKTRCSLYRRLDGPYGRSGRVRKFSPRPPPPRDV